MHVGMKKNEKERGRKTEEREKSKKNYRKKYIWLSKSKNEKNRRNRS